MSRLIKENQGRSEKSICGKEKKEEEQIRKEFIKIKTVKKLYEGIDHYQNIFGSTLERILDSNFQDQFYYINLHHSENKVGMTQHKSEMLKRVSFIKRVKSLWQEVKILYS